MPMGKNGWFEAGKPIRVEGGLKARTARGSIGEQWWSRRFIDILEGICDGGRLARGRAYARKGQVLGFDLRAGVVTARVQGSRPAPYKVTIKIQAYADTAWRAIEEALARQALYRAKLLAGEMPREIEEVFDGLGLPLFPSSLDMKCSCPDWAGTARAAGLASSLLAPGGSFPCKHLSAVLYLLAEAFDDDPFLVLAWRGRARDELLDSLRGLVDDEDAPGDPLHVDDAPFAQRLTDFYAPATSLGRLRSRPDAVPVPPELLLRALEPPDVKVRHIPLVDILRSAYSDLGGAGD